ncbi:MAG: LemA family protein [Candidatus Gottesmanbacteria bacterium GW2011_GWA1_43_11]|uniref:LemA family protein n=1 Tax=Candidatus Gottesmanbacteria bacterium GW2011_GWA1_43_11 TaxID=1618436 RepID=A0A0G1CE79_9BACT|nr:MAG: LemA family protein [Candidatus Gottesmanbacteria bacterium GW2011_GWA1_43_11]
MPVFLIFGVGIVLIVLFVWSLYNNLVTLRVRIKEAWSQIDVQLKRRADLIPNLVESVKSYAKHEKEVFENVTKARSVLMSARGPHEKAQADNMLTGALKSLFAVAEAYPNLRASENFQQLQKELSDTEDKVAYSRQFYNSVVMEYNTKIIVFPNSMIAAQFGFKSEEFFAANEEERKKVEVKF